MNIKLTFNGRCSSVNRTNWEVITNNGEEIIAKINNSFTGKDFPIVGDTVQYAQDEWGNNFILSVDTPKNRLIRKYNGAPQNIASNIDVVFVVSSMNKEFNIAKIERFALLGRIPGAKLCFILTKKDLCPDPDTFTKIVEERFPGFPVIAMNALKGEGIDKLKELWGKGDTAIFIGSSGVGKSTIVNSLSGKEVMKTSDIRESDSKGRHTTTSRNMIMLEDGRAIIDTPGVRSVGIVDNVLDEIKEMFKEIADLEENCQYSDCSHSHEAGCAVKQAVVEGIISEDMLKRYLKFKAKEKSRKEIQQEDTAELSEWQKVARTKGRKKQRW